MVTITMKLNETSIKFLVANNGNYRIVYDDGKMSDVMADFAAAFIALRDAGFKEEVA